MKRLLDIIAWSIVAIVYGGFALCLVVGMGYLAWHDPLGFAKLALGFIGFFAVLSWAMNRIPRKRR
jgi:hypothetical protein